MNLFTELKRRNVFRMGIAYVVVAWVLLQAIDFVLDVIAAPDWVLQVFLLAAVAGLPIVLIFSWVFEITPDGIKRESEVDRSHSITQHTGRKLDRTIITFLALAVVLLLGERFISEKGSGSISPAPSQAESSAAAEKLSLTPSAKPAPEPETKGVRSVAVLPFVNMSSDPEQEYFSDGLSEELLNRLAQNSQLQVAARTSSFQFKGQNQDIGEIGRQLKVDHVLEGSVRKSGNRLRITAQLIRVNSGFHLWSETYEREMDDVFAIQDDISKAISTALEAQLGAAATAPEHNPTDNMEAYQAYLQGRFLLNKRGAANMTLAHEQFEKATRLDPAFSNAWSGMAFNYALLPSYRADVSARQAWELVQASANRALQLDPKNAEAYTALARADIDDDLKTVLGLFEKAYELAPRNPDVVNLYGDFMTSIGDIEAALRLEQEAVNLDPLSAVHQSDLAFLMFLLDRDEEGLNYARNSASLEPSAVRTDPLIMGLILTGKYSEAEKLIKTIEQQTDTEDDLINTWWCFMYYQMGDEQNLRQRLAERMDKLDIGSGSFDMTFTAFIVAALDGTDAALPILEKAYATSATNLWWPMLFYLPEYVSDDPDWLAFWERPGLAETMALRRSNPPQGNIGIWGEWTPR